MAMIVTGGGTAAADSVEDGSTEGGNGERVPQTVIGLDVSLLD